MIRRPPRSTLDRSSAASDVYKRQELENNLIKHMEKFLIELGSGFAFVGRQYKLEIGAVSYTHLRAHETVLDLVCRLLLEKKKTKRS